MKKPKAPRLVSIAILTTITIIFWIFISLYNILTKTPNVEIDKSILEPISPNLNQDSLNSLNERVFFEEGEVVSPIIILPENISPTPSPTPTPNIEPSITATPEARIHKPVG